MKIQLPLGQLVIRYKKGESTHKLGRAYGVSQGTIWLRLRAARVKMRGRGRTKPGGPLSDNGKGYIYTLDREGKPSYLHRICWATYHGPIPARHDIHHKNGNRSDNQIENLLCISHAEHTSLHRNMEATQ